MKKSKFSAFSLARVSSAVVAEVRVVDVLSIRPTWTAVEAERFLAEHSAAIAAVMLTFGIKHVADLLEEGERHVN